MTKAIISRIAAVTAVIICTGCSSYASFIETLNSRQMNSCVEGQIVVGSMLSGQGMLHVYTATGGQNVVECIQMFRH